MTDYFYRVEETTYSAGCDEFGDPLPGGPTMTNLHAYEVIKRTPCGAWIAAGDTGRKFVLLTANKRYAVPTVEEAIESFKARKKRQKAIYAARIKSIDEALRYLDEKGFYSDQRKWVGVTVGL